MGILWVIEKPHKKKRQVKIALQGDFPVRAFSSFGSFVKLGPLKGRQKPDAILVNLACCPYKIEPIDLYLAENFPSSLRIFIAEKEEVMDLQKPGRFILDADIDAFKFSTLVENLLDLKTASKDVISYKDLRMDTAGLVVTDSTSDIKERLTLKEGKLLRYFLTHPGRCIERAELIDQVWDKIKVSPRTIDSQISRLRRRLQPMNVSIDAVYGGGYVLK